MLELEEDAIELVDEEHGLDALGERLLQDGARLYAHALHRVDDHERAVGGAQRCGDLWSVRNAVRVWRWLGAPQR